MAIEQKSRQMSRVHVAVGVIENGAGAVLISRRGASQHQAGKWEFPGGKVEAGESLPEALARELYEELGIRVLSCRALMVVDHDYVDKQVRLDVWRVTSFSGEPTGREGQAVSWVAIPALAGYAFPEANTPIVEAVMALRSTDGTDKV